MSTFSRIRKQVIHSSARNFMYIHVFKSNKNLYTQIIDPYSGHILLSASTLEMQGSTFGNTKASSEILAKLLVDRVNQAGFTHLKIWKTRNPNKHFYHGRIKAFIDSARSEGLIIE